MFEYDNRFVQALPGDHETKNFRRQVHGACYSRVSPTAVAQPKLVAYSREMCDELGLSAAQVQSEEFAQVFGGNRILPGMDPFAMCYGGHQFGHWAGQLGDGRAINLAEVKGREGRRWTLQLKGAGPTPYSRTADGLAVLRSSIREFLCSEAMHHLGVPTTRALSLVTTGEEVVRDMFYDGRPQAEPGAVVCRVAPNFIRFGNFEILTARSEHELLRQLADYTIETDFPDYWTSSSQRGTAEFYAGWLAEIGRRTARLMVEWMRVGFVHGVMNTDNMSILGLTIDYGPYGWLEDYDPSWTPNTTDAHGRRYAFGQQPQIGLWNMVRLANALWPLVEDKPLMQEALDQYSQTYQAGFREMMAGKLGLREFHAEDESHSTIAIEKPNNDDQLVEELFGVLRLVETDYTIFFRQLGSWQENWAALEPSSQVLATSQAPELLCDAYYDLASWTPEVGVQVAGWLRKYLDRLQVDGQHPTERRQQMNAHNPKYVLRNYMAQLAIDAATVGDHSVVAELLELLRNPYDEQAGQDKWAEKRPDWARHRAGCSMLSCSS